MVASCVAGTLLWAAASMAVAQADNESASATTMLASAFHATGLTNRMFPSLHLSIWMTILTSCVAGTLQRAGALIAMSQADMRAMSTTTMVASTFCKLFIHLPLLLLITCDHMDVCDVWVVAAILHCSPNRVFLLLVWSKATPQTPTVRL